MSEKLAAVQQHHAQIKEGFSEWAKEGKEGHDAHLASAVENGHITQAEADSYAAAFDKWIASGKEMLESNLAAVVAKHSK